MRNTSFSDFKYSVSRRGALCAAAALPVAALAPRSAFANVEVEEHIAESWRFGGGVPIDDLEPDNGAMLRGSGPKWGKNGSGQWCNSLGDPIPGAIFRGIDVSEWQGDINWNAVKGSDVNYAILRAAAYSEREDYKWARNVSECERLGIPFGAYIYSYATSVADAVNEADYIIGRLKGHKPSYPIYIDLEDNSIQHADLNAIAAAFCQRIESAGYRAGVYANLNWWNTKLTSSTLDKWSRWVAQYNITCDFSGSKDMWQATSKGTISGINGNVDINFDFVGLNNPYPDQTTWKRVYGQDQFDTMQAISKLGWPSSSSVVIATDATYWDALAASSLAGIHGCPILLTRGSSLSSQAREEIRRLGAKTAYICGGPIAIASSVDDQVRSAGCSSVVRVYGPNQQGTAREIAKAVQDSGAGSDMCIIATDWKFQDALSISPFAYAKKAPIYLCESGSNVLSNDSIVSIKRGGYRSAIIVGGPVAVNSQVEGQLSSAGVSNVKRIYGQTEYETSLQIASWEISEGMSVGNLGVATGVTHYDALAGAALCGKNNSALVIVSDNNRVCLNDFVSQHKGEVSVGYVYGGEIAVSRTTWNVLLQSYFG